MRILSFAWTTQAFLEGRKTVTRRKWTQCCMHPGELVQAYDRNPRAGGKCIGIIKILSVSREPLANIRQPGEMEKEGYSDPERHIEVEPDEFIKQWKKNYPGYNEQDLLWRLEFEVVSVVDRKGRKNESGIIKNNC